MTAINTPTHIQDPGTEAAPVGAPRGAARQPPITALRWGAIAVGLALGFAGGDGAGSLVELPRRAWHALATPAEHLPGPPRRGPTRFALYDDRPREEDPPDA